METIPQTEEEFIAFLNDKSAVHAMLDRYAHVLHSDPLSLADFIRNNIDGVDHKARLKLLLGLYIKNQEAQGLINNVIKDMK